VPEGGPVDPRGREDAEASGTTTDVPAGMPPAAAPPAAARARAAARPARAAAGDFLRRVVQKADEDNVFFLAGAIAFNLLVAVVPFVLAILSIAGMVFQTREADPAGTLLRYLTAALPTAALSREFVESLRHGLNELIAQSTGLLSATTIVFIWFATRLVGTLRTALKEIFNLSHERSIIRGKLFDMGIVIAAGTLLATNVALTVVFQVLASYGVVGLGFGGDEADRVHRALPAAAALATAWTMFVLIYRYLPVRRIPWRVALIAATFTAVLFEVLKFAFGWYATNLANYRTAFGNFATVIVLFLWVYYMCVAFVLGGEVGHVAHMQRTRHAQKERLG
jgi:membrane protein